MKILGIAVLALLLPQIPACPPGPPQPTPTPTASPTPTPTPTPTPADLRIDFTRFDLVDGGPSLDTWDEELLNALIAAHPDHCGPGDCVLQMYQAEWHARVCAEMLTRGKACGFTDEDQITVGDSNLAGARVQNHRIYAGPANPSEGTGRRTVKFPPFSRTGGDNPPNSWTLHSKSDPTPPTPTPGPTPDPACGTPDPLDSTWSIPCVLGGHWNVKFYNPQQQILDATWTCDYYYTDEHPEWKPLAHDWCVAIGMGDMGGSPRSKCPVRPDGHPQRVPCEKRLHGAVTWIGNGNVEKFEGNPTFARCLDCTELRVCWQDGTHCKQVIP